MDLTLSDEQRLLRESVDRFIAGSYDADHRRRIASDLSGGIADVICSEQYFAFWPSTTVAFSAGF